MIISQMSSQIHCPQCGQPTESSLRTCEKCGVVLAIAAVLAEREILPHRIDGSLAVTPEILVPRLGEYLIEKGKLTRPNLERALDYQKKKSRSGKTLLLGQALRELELITAEELDQAITEQILNLQVALRRSNQELEARVRERTIELERALEMLGELNQLKANFIANVSHELRTPLTHIKGYLGVMATGELGPISVDQADALRVMQQAEARLERLIEDLIQFALISRGQLTLSLSHANIAEMVENVVNQVQQKANLAGINLETDISEGLPLAVCDNDKIAWVIGHLLDNACKFTPRGGRVKLEVDQSDKFVKIAVTDTGIGIPAHRMPEIFEPFHQLDGSSTRQFSGTGLGLALSQRILTAHGTQIEVQSQEEKGSRFEFLLPLAEVAMQM